MKFNLSFGIACAIVLHVGFILFGGLLFISHTKDHGTLQRVELLSEEDIAAAEKEKLKEHEPEEAEEMETERELRTPLRSFATSNCLPQPMHPSWKPQASVQSRRRSSGQAGGGGDFAEALSFSSGGRIGGMDKGGALDDSLEKAFSLAEIDQKPRAIFQAAPVYPAGKHALEVVVSVVFVVDQTGKVTNLRVEKSTNPAFEKPAVDAVKQWKFEPAIKAGQRVPCKMRVPIRFQPR